MDSNYSNQWPVKKATGSKRSKWIVIVSVVVLLALVAVGVAVGVVVSRNNKSTSGGAAKGGSSNSNGGGGGESTPSVVTQTDPNDPSTFVKDPKLKRSFYGMAYTPEGAQLPQCGISLATTIQDIQILSQLTKRIRLYVADCNQSAMVLEAIKQTKVDMTVYLGNYAIPDDNGTAYNRQRDLIRDALVTYGADHVAGVTVGNEYMLNYMLDHQTTDPDSAIANLGAAPLIADIQDTRNMLKSLSLDGKVPVGNSDAESYFNTQVLTAIDYGLSNVHPWFGNVSVNEAAAWTSSFFNELNVKRAASLPNHPKMYIAETGWPTKSSDAANANNGASIASEANLQIFLDTFVCQANQNGTGYFFFEYFDEIWKEKLYGGVEGWWGLLKSDRTLKNVVIPDCPAS